MGKVRVTRENSLLKCSMTTAAATAGLRERVSRVTGSVPALLPIPMPRPEGHGLPEGRGVPEGQVPEGPKSARRAGCQRGHEVP